MRWRLVRSPRPAGSGSSGTAVAANPACRLAFDACRISPITGRNRYFLTICTYEKHSIFTAGAVVDVVRTQILLAAEACGFEVIAYCFMPDHLHLVVQGMTDTASRPAFTQRAKQRSGYHGKRATGQSVWQVGYHDRVIWLEADIPAMVAYVLANPVRAGLAQHASDYPFCWKKPELKLGPTGQLTTEQMTNAPQGRPEL